MFIQYSADRSLACESHLASNLMSIKNKDGYCCNGLKLKGSSANLPGLSSPFSEDKVKLSVYEVKRKLVRLAADHEIREALRELERANLLQRRTTAHNRYLYSLNEDICHLVYLVFSLMSFRLMHEGWF